MQTSECAMPLKPLWKWGITLVAVVSVNALAQEVTLKISHFFPPTSNAHANILVPWTQRVEAASKGRIKFQIYPSMQLGGAPNQLFDQAKDGVADIVWTLPGYTPGRFPTSEVFELPLMVQSGEQASRAIWEYSQRHLIDEFKGVKLLSVHTHDAGLLHMVKKPIRTLEDLRGEKIRAPNRVANKMLAALGASPVSLPFTSLQEGLSKGILDGLFITWEALPSTKINEVVKFHTEMPQGSPALYTSVIVIAMNEAKYNALTADLRTLLDSNSGMELGALIGRTWDQSAIAAREAELGSGDKLITLEAKEYARWQRAAQRVAREWVSEMRAKNIDAVTLLDDAQRFLAKYAVNARR
jgi:TRAP-type C4-dicarboxylate transport system substrate-binding protein